MQRLGGVATTAEACGFSSLWAPDHIGMPQVIDSTYPNADDGAFPVSAEAGWLDPVVALASAGQATTTIRLGFGVMVLPLWEPVRVAKQIASLDVLSAGRISVGIGRGWLREEFDLLDRSFANRGAQAEDGVASLRRIWRDGGLWDPSSGRFMSILPRPFGDIEVLWGGKGPLTLKRVASMGDGWMPSGLSLEEVGEGVDRLRALQEEGEDRPARLRVVHKTPVDGVDASYLEEACRLGIDEVVVDVAWEDVPSEQHEDIVRRLAGALLDDERATDEEPRG